MPAHRAPVDHAGDAVTVPVLVVRARVRISSIGVERDISTWPFARRCGSCVLAKLPGTAPSNGGREFNATRHRQPGAPSFAATGHTAVLSRWPPRGGALRVGVPADFLRTADVTDGRCKRLLDGGAGDRGCKLIACRTGETRIVGCHMQQGRCRPPALLFRPLCEGLHMAAVQRRCAAVDPTAPAALGFSKSPGYRISMDVGMAPAPMEGRPAAPTPLFRRQLDPNEVRPRQPRGPPLLD